MIQTPPDPPRVGLKNHTICVFSCRWKIRNYPRKQDGSLLNIKGICLTGGKGLGIVTEKMGIVTDFDTKVVRFSIIGLSKVEKNRNHRHNTKVV